MLWLEDKDSARAGSFACVLPAEARSRTSARHLLHCGSTGDIQQSSITCLKLQGHSCRNQLEQNLPRMIEPDRHCCRVRLRISKVDSEREELQTLRHRYPGCWRRGEECSVQVGRSWPGDDQSEWRVRGGSVECIRSLEPAAFRNISQLASATKSNLATLGVAASRHLQPLLVATGRRRADRQSYGKKTAAAVQDSRCQSKQAPCCQPSLSV